MNCRQGSVEEKDITDEVVEKLHKLEINPLFLDWALDYLDTQKGQAQAQNKEIEANKDNRAKELEAQLSGLTIMRTKNLIDDEEYLKEKSTFKKELEKLQKVEDKKETENDLIELTKEKFIFATYGKKKFIEGDKMTKKEILADLGSNREIKDKKVRICLHKWLLPIYENAEIYNAKLARLEPEKFGLDYRKSDALASLRLSWLPGSDSNRRPIGYTYPLIS